MIARTPVSRAGSATALRINQMGRSVEDFDAQTDALKARLAEWEALTSDEYACAEEEIQNLAAAEAHRDEFERNCGAMDLDTETLTNRLRRVRQHARSAQRAVVSMEARLTREYLAAVGGLREHIAEREEYSARLRGLEPGESIEVWCSQRSAPLEIRA